MKAIWNNAIIAESNATIIVEGNHYFPWDAIHQQFFQKSAHTSICSWKGFANYYTIHVNGKENENAAWVYQAPKTEAAEIAGYVAFWQGVTITE